MPEIVVAFPHSFDAWNILIYVSRKLNPKFLCKFRAHVLSLGRKRIQMGPLNLKL